MAHSPIDMQTDIEYELVGRPSKFELSYATFGEEKSGNTAPFTAFLKGKGKFNLDVRVERFEREWFTAEKKFTVYGPVIHNHGPVGLWATIIFSMNGGSATVVVSDTPQPPRK